MHGGTEHGTHRARGTTLTQFLLTISAIRNVQRLCIVHLPSNLLQRLAGTLGWDHLGATSPAPSPSLLIVKQTAPHKVRAQVHDRNATDDANPMSRAPFWGVGLCSGNQRKKLPIPPPCPRPRPLPSSRRSPHLASMFRFSNMLGYDRTLPCVRVRTRDLLHCILWPGDSGLA